MLVRFIYKLNFNYRLLSSPFKMQNSTKCTVAVCQMTSRNNKDENLKTVKKLVTEAASNNAKVIFLPEASDYIGSDLSELITISEPLDGPTLSEYKKLSKDLDVWLSIGGFHEKNDNGKISNSHVLIDNSGNIVAIYRKLHMFDVAIPEKKIFLRESKAANPGQEIVPPVNTPAGPLSLSICYDVRFPELSILQRKQGASILTYPSAFTAATGQAHWEVLLRSRAIETQCYVIAAAQYGKHNAKRISYGQAMVVDPWGNILAECPKYNETVESNESFALATIDLDKIEKIRKEMPVFEHRRNDIYELKAAVKPLPIGDKETFKFADKTIEGSFVFYKTNHCYAFTNIRCVVPGHVLISPRRHAQRLEDLSPEEISDLFQTAIEVEKIMEKVHSTTSSTVCIQDGKNAGQTIPHVHVHILPRKENDFGRNDDIYTELANHDREDNPKPFRTSKEMCEEASQLRELFY